VESGRTLIKILVCDDDPEDRKLIRTYLSQVADKEIVILEAGQTTEIQNALSRGRVDLVLMDIQMPERSGIEWLKEIVGKQIAPVVMLTGHGNEEVAVESLQEGAIGYLSKNRVSEKKLVDTIDDAIQKWRELILSKATQKQLERLANVDSLTGLLNRRAMLGRLEEAMAHARRYEEDLCVLMLDIDHFKLVNDEYGHIVGDDVLEKVGALLRKKVRDTDAIGRYGGDEFIVILSKTELSSAQCVAERIRQAIITAKMQDPQGNSFSITVSQGLTKYKPGDDRESLISRADSALYQAKRKGRDRIEICESIAVGA
jgi:diguanylate cyclase (GGDEF)-like protein